MEEERQPEGGHTETVAWRANGARSSAGAHLAESPGWAEPAPAGESPTEPAPALTTGAADGDEARHRSPAVPGLNDDTPPGGLAAVEPPLWREALRRAPGTTYGTYQPAHRERSYQPTPEDDLVDRPAEPTAPEYGGGAEPVSPVEPSPARPADGSEPAAAAGGLPPPGTAALPATVPPAGLAPASTESVAGESLAGAEPGLAVPAELEPASLPQRVPAEPDVPVSTEPATAGPPVSDPGAGRDRWTAPELAWIADQLRRDDVPGELLAEPLDVDAVMTAVREVAGVRSASVRANPTGVHTLRLDLADDADPGQVSRAVARLLLERMGLSAAPQPVPQPRASEPGSTQPGDLAPPLVAAERGEQHPGPAWVEPDPPEVPRSAWVEPDPPEVPRSAWVEPDPPEVPRSAWVEPDPPEVPQPAWVEPDPPEVPQPASRPLYPAQPGLRVLIDQVQVSTYGLESTVEVQLTAGDRHSTGVASGPAADSYLVRLAAVAAAKAVDALLREVAEPGGPSRCFVEHTGVVAFGSTEVAVVVVLLVCGGWVEQLTGSALVDGDPRQAVVRATLGAVNRRLEALLA